MSGSPRFPASLAGDLAATWEVLWQPGATFARLRERRPVLAPWLVASVLSAALALLTVSISQRAAVYLVGDLDAPELRQEVQQSLEHMKRFTVGLAPIVVAVRWGGTALLLWAAAVLAGVGTTYRAALSIVAYSAVPGLLGQGLDLGVTWFEGPEFTPELTPVASSATSLGALLPAVPGPWAAALLARVTPFTLWGGVLWVTGLRAALGAGWTRAAAAAVPVWSVLLVTSAATEVIGNSLAGNGAGLG